MKMISKKYSQDMKNFVEQILIKFRSFYLIDELGSICAVDKHTEISVKIRISADIKKGKYRWTDMSVSLWPRYLKESQMKLLSDFQLATQKLTF